MRVLRCVCRVIEFVRIRNERIRGQGSKSAVAMVANATMFCHLLPGCSSGSKHLLQW